MSLNLFAWQDKLDSLEAIGELEQAVLYLDSMSYEEDEIIEQVLILEELSDYFNLLDMDEEYLLNQQRLKLQKEKMRSTQEAKMIPQSSDDAGAEKVFTPPSSIEASDSTREEGQYVELQLLQSLQARSDVSTQRQTVDTTQFSQIVYGLDYFQSDGMNYSIIDLQFRLERERFRENNFFSNVDSNISQTTSLGVGLSYTAGNDFWFHNLSLDWLPIIQSESSQEQGGVDNFYITEFVRLNNSVTPRVAMPISLYVSYAKQWNTSVGTEFSIDVEPIRFLSLSLGAYANATRLHQSNYEHTTLAIENDSLARRFDNLSNIKGTINFANAERSQYYDNLIQSFQAASIDEATLTEKFQLDPYYLGINTQFEVYLFEGSIGLQFDLSQGRFFQSEKYYTVQDEPSSYLSLNALVESNDQLYGLLSEGDFDYYDKVQARYQNPIFVTYHIKPYLNYQFKEKWGLELNMFYEQRDYSVAPVYLGYRPQQSAQEIDLGIALNGNYRL